ncbi:hypothetical protein F751_0601 [Auxenochlorella protothecoides]|uniref:Uncharacterized protein n=1 Tax=Auxenochlorella protothecoides TaxID=3075 RepID=A0A087SIM0_AUXPR|nr:hypothetical protein F751_0601 [Auxenochlorella protothecoides]KFM25574.1 hypothetical protein F751_0601 [Auxenochlorella protothecoides]RMZ54683.1 hypothetical protein APUTEX25_003061 [Auxenochlorella protothecoides]|eukprot:RMZ54683.1 hypothetical protein APUTEX25_003061 [Auxenochlorella protothecoides]
MTTSPALHVYADDTSLDATDGWTMPQEPELASRPSGVSDAAGAWIKRICLQHENTSTEALFAHFQEVPKRAELTYYNDIFLPVMSRYPPHELMAQADAQPHVAPLPHTIGPSSKGLTAVPRRVLGDVTNRTPTRLVR